MNYPKAIKAFYMRVNDDGRTVAAMDVLAPGAVFTKRVLSDEMLPIRSRYSVGDRRPESANQTGGSKCSASLYSQPR